MKKSLFKTLCCALTLALCFCVVPVSIYAEDDGFHIILESDGKSAYIHEYTGTAEDVVVPSHTKSGIPITYIESGAFSGNRNIKSVKIPDTVKVIEQNAFWGCTNLFSISLPDSLERIERKAFYNTAFYNTSAVWFDYTLYIDGYLIENRHNEIGPVNIAYGTKGIADEAFFTSLVSSVNIPASVKFIGETSFNDVFYFEEFTVDPESPYYKSVDGLLFTADDKLVKYPPCKEDISYILPRETKSIGNHCFHDVENLKELYLYENVSSIDKYAFLNYSTSLLSVLVDSNNQHYKSDDCVVYTADGKTLVYYPQGSTEKKFVFPDGVTDVAYKALSYNKHIEEIEFGEGLLRVEEFSYLENLKTITFPASVEYFDRFCFSGCDNLATINFRGTEEQWKEACGRYTFGEGATINFLYQESTVPDTEPTETTPTKVTITTEPIESSTAVITTTATEPAESTSAEVTTTDSEPAESSTATVPATTTEPAESTTATYPAEGTTSTAPAGDKYMTGDVNLDGKLNIRDATLIQKHLAKIIELKDTELTLADFDLNGEVNIKDATAIQKKIANII